MTREIDDLDRRAITDDLESSTTLPPVAGRFWVKGMNKYTHKRAKAVIKKIGRRPSKKPVTLARNPMENLDD